MKGQWFWTLITTHKCELIVMMYYFVELLNGSVGHVSPDRRRGNDGS